MDQQKNFYKLIIAIVFILLICSLFSDAVNNLNNGNSIIDLAINNDEKVDDDSVFKIISSSENKDIEDIVRAFASSNNIDISIEYAGTLDIMDKLNSGAKYDAVWASNSIWLYMLNDDIKISNSKSTSINPVVFAISKNKAQDLGFVDRDIYTNEIISAIQSGKLKFSMSNPTRTNTGATAYLGLLSTISGSPEVLKEEHLKSPMIKDELVSLFSGLQRSSGSDEFLEEAFINGDYEAIVTYEASIININKQLEEKGKETLYVLYPIDGVSISDSPLAFIDNGNSNKKDMFLKIQNYILSNSGQSELAKTGRRTWFGGVNSSVDETIFNPTWGINTEKYIVPTKFPSTKIIQEALALYQQEFRKPVHAIFCLDFSGSMQGEGYKQLTEAMDYILDQEKAKKDLLQFTEKDKITVIPFSTNVLGTWTTDNGSQTTELKRKISSQRPSGSTNLYDTSIAALDILNKEDINEYNLSIILMTDGLSNVGKYSNLKDKYLKYNKDIPIYSIMFGSAHENELQNIAELTNAKVFDGKTDLLKAFKEVRGYN